MALVEWTGTPDDERDELVARLNRARKIGEDGRPYFEGDPLFDDVVGVLESALKFPDEVPEIEARRAVGAALFAGGTGEAALGAEGLHREIEGRIGEFLDATPSPYVLVGSVSAEYFEELTEKEILGCRIAFHRRVPEPFREGHRRVEDLMRSRVPGDYRASGFFALRYTFVTVEAKGRSETEAAAKAQRALDVQRGIWNLALFRLAPPTGSSRPLNHVLPGPVQSLHLPNGEAIPWAAWYEPDYVGPVGGLDSRTLKRYWDGVQEYEKLAREGLSESRYPSAVEGFVRDYVRILDGRDPEAAFVRLWGLLERLVGLDDRERHTVVTRRAAFLVRAELRGLQYRVLEALRRHRNAGVHEGAFPSDARDLLRQLRRFVVFAVEFHLEERFGFSDPKEAARFLSQPSEAAPLRERIRTLQRQGREEDLRLAQMAMEYHGHDT